MGIIGKWRAFGIAISGGILSAYGYDKFHCWKLHQQALEKAKKLGEEPLTSSNVVASTAKRLVIFYTCRNAFHHQFIASAFSSYAGNYLTLAGIDYELHQFILSKAQFPGSTLENKEAILNDLYASPERYSTLMEGIQPEKYNLAWQKVKNSSLLCALSSADSIYSPTAAALGRKMIVIPCETSNSFLVRLFTQAFAKRIQLARIIDSTFELIEIVNK